MATYTLIHPSNLIPQTTYNVGNLGGNDAPFGLCWDGNNWFVIDLVDLLVYKYTANFASLVTSYDINALSAGANATPYDIEWDGTSFYITDNTDGAVYKCWKY